MFPLWLTIVIALVVAGVFIFVKRGQMKSKEEIEVEIERVNQILKDKADRNDMSDWNYYTFYREGLYWCVKHE